MKIARYSIDISNVEKINPLFSKCDIKVCYHGINRNNTLIDKETINRAIPSIYNIPIIGEYLETVDNFGGHGGKLEISDKGAKYIQTTIPYGVVPESADVHWEIVTENSGKMNEYLVIKGAYLWTGRYPETEMIIGKQFNQSMEISVNKGSFVTVDGGRQTYKITDFIFSALCILGINKESDPNGNVEPCFESASIVAYSLARYKTEFDEMMKDLKSSLDLPSNEGNQIDNSEEGGNEVDKELEKEVFDGEESQVETTETPIDAPESQQEEKVVETAQEEPVEEEVLEEPQEEQVQEETTEEETPAEVEPETTEAEETETEEVTTLLKSIEEMKEELAEHRRLIEELKEKFLLKQVEYSKLSEEHDALVIKFNEVNEKYTIKLAEEKAEKINQLFEQFANELSLEELEPIRQECSNYSLEELSDKLYLMVGKKKAKFGSQKKQNKLIPIHDEIEDKPKKNGKSYDYLFEQ